MINRGVFGHLVFSVLPVRVVKCIRSQTSCSHVQRPLKNQCHSLTTVCKFNCLYNIMCLIHSLRTFCLPQRNTGKNVV